MENHEEEHEPTASEIVSHCDNDQSGGISKKEAHKCIQHYCHDHEHRRILHKEVDDVYRGLPKGTEIPNEEVIAHLKEHDAEHH